MECKTGLEWVTPFHATGIFLYPPENVENCWFSERDQWHEMGSQRLNGFVYFLVLITKMGNPIFAKYYKRGLGTIPYVIFIHLLEIHQSPYDLIIVKSSYP